MGRSGSGLFSSSQASPQDEAKEIVSQRTIKGDSKKRASPGASPDPFQKLSPSLSSKLSYRTAPRYTSSSRDQSASRSSDSGSPTPLEPATPSVKGSGHFAPGQTRASSPAVPTSASRKRFIAKEATTTNASANSQKFSSKHSPNSSLDSSPNSSRSPSPNQSGTKALRTIPKISQQRTNNGDIKEVPVTQKPKEITNTFTKAPLPFDVSDSESDHSLVNTYTRLAADSNRFSESSAEESPLLSSDETPQQTPITSPIRSLSNSPDRTPDRSPKRSAKTSVRESPAREKRGKRSTKSSPGTSREMSPEALQQHSSRRIRDRSLVTEPVKEMAAPINTVPAEEKVLTPAEKPLEQAAEEPLSKKPSSQKAAVAQAEVAVAAEAEAAAPLTQSIFPDREEVFVRRIYRRAPSAGFANVFHIQNILQEERRRNGQYTAVFLVLVAALMGLYHACRAQNAVLAGFLVPALIMLLYLLWVLYSAQRARAKQLQLMRALGEANCADAPPLLALDASAAGECKILILPDEAAHRSHRAKVKGAKRVASPKRTRSPATREIPKVVIKGPTPVRELGPDLVI